MTPLLNGWLEAYLAKWRSHFATVGHPFVSLQPDEYSVRWNPRMRSRAGVCRVQERVIELNPHLITTPDILEEILVHELCHLSTSLRWPRSRPHGMRWQKLMRICGFEPRRCHTLKPTRKFLHRTWELHCGCGSHHVTTRIYNRIQRGNRYRCLRCKNPLRQKTSERSLVEKLRSLF